MRAHAASLAIAAPGGADDEILRARGDGGEDACETDRVVAAVAIHERDHSAPACGAASAGETRRVISATRLDHVLRAGFVCPRHRLVATAPVDDNHLVDDVPRNRTDHAADRRGLV